MAKHGDLEKYLGSQYAKQLQENNAYNAYQECREILDGSMNVLSMLSKISLVRQGFKPVIEDCSKQKQRLGQTS